MNGTLKTVELVEMPCCAVAQFGEMYDGMSGLFGQMVLGVLNQSSMTHLEFSSTLH